MHAADCPHHAKGAAARVSRPVTGPTELVPTRQNQPSLAPAAHDIAAPCASGRSNRAVGDVRVAGRNMCIRGDRLTYSGVDGYAGL